MAVGVGSVKPEFDVDVVVTRADRPDVLEMKAVGHAPRNEFETVAEMELKENASGGTTVVWSATADVSGTIASPRRPRAQERHQTAGQEILLEDAGESRRGRRGRVRTRGRARAKTPRSRRTASRAVFGRPRPRFRFGPFDGFSVRSMCSRSSVECRLSVHQRVLRPSVRLGCGENVHSPLGAALSLLGAALPFRAESARAIRAESSNRTANERERRRRVGYCSDSRSFFRRWSGATGI